MTPVFYRLFCEYDYGQENLIFRSEDKAKEFLQKQIDLQGDDWTAEELWNDGLADTEKVEIYE